MLTCLKPSLHSAAFSPAGCSSEQHFLATEHVINYNLHEDRLPKNLVSAKCYCKLLIVQHSCLSFTLDLNILVVKQVDSLTYHSVCVCHLQELCAALSIPKGADPQAVGRMELLHEEVAAYLNDLG